MLTRLQKYVTIIIRTNVFLALIYSLVLRGHIRLSDWWQLFGLWLLRREYERD